MRNSSCLHTVEGTERRSSSLSLSIRANGKENEIEEVGLVFIDSGLVMAYRLDFRNARGPDWGKKKQQLLRGHQWKR